MLKIKVLVNVETVEVTCDASDFYTAGAVRFIGDVAAINELKGQLDGAYGPFGHLFSLGETALPNDLAFVISQLPKPEYLSKVIEGEELTILPASNPEAPF